MLSISQVAVALVMFPIFWTLAPWIGAKSTKGVPAELLPANCPAVIMNHGESSCFPYGTIADNPWGFAACTASLLAGWAFLVWSSSKPGDFRLRGHAALRLALLASAAAALLLVPVAAPILGLDAAPENVQLGLFLALWAPVLMAVVQASGLVRRGLGLFSIGLVTLELLAAASALVSTSFILIVLCVLAAFLWWLTGYLGIRRV